MAPSKSCAVMCSATAWVFATQSISGELTTRLPPSPISWAVAFGPSVSSRSTAARPSRVARYRSNALGAPPRWTCPRMVIRVSSPSSVSRSVRIACAVIGLPARSWAPSATMTTLCRRPMARPASMSRHICCAQSSGGGCSGIITQFAAVAMDAISARYPQWRPITSTTKVRWWLEPVLRSASIASTIRCRAVSAPIVMSVPDMSLSIEPTRPTSLRKGCRAATSGEISPEVTSSASSPAHSCRNRLAPVRLPSPPMTTSASMPRSTMFFAAVRRPSWVRNCCDRAVPMAVPPRCRMPSTSPGVIFWIRSPPLTRPWYPSWMA